MIGFGIDQAKGLFFDRAPVMSAVDRGARNVLSKFGSYVRQRARTSIKKREGTSAVGSPPYSHGQHLLRNWILFAYEPTRRSVVIGPAKLAGKVGNAPEALEKGGRSEALMGLRGKRRRTKTRVRARPYMMPAFLAELPGVPALWRDSIR